MGIRMSGLASGLDTESIVGALMSAQSLKKTRVSNQKTKLEWKQAKWAELNTKLKKLYTDYVTKMQLQSSYMTKKATSSDTSKLNVTASSTAANGSYSLEIKNIATSQYITGSKINAENTSDKLVDLDSSLLNKEVTVTNGDKTTQFTISADMTIDSFNAKLKEAGLNASYDKTQKRFFISSKNSGLENAFSITTAGVTDAEVAGRASLLNAVGYSGMTTDNRAIVDAAMETLETSGVGTDEYNKALDSLSKAAYDTKVTASKSAATTYVRAKLYSENYATYKTTAENALKSNYYNEDGTTVKDDLATEYGDKFDIYTAEEKTTLGIDGMSKEEYVNWQANADYTAAVAKQADSQTTSFVNSKISSDDATKLEIDTAAYAGVTASEISTLDETALAKYYGAGTAESPRVVNDIVGTSTYSEDSVKSDISSTVSDYASITDRNFSLSTSALNSLGLADIAVAADGSVTVNGGANDSTNSSIPSGMAVIAASDSKVILNGAELTSSSSTVSANGLSMELTGLTEIGKPITFSVSNDVDTVYNSIKSFLTEYNSIMKEMNTLYNASSAKGYEPLSSEQKEAMTDDDVKLWEDKIKDSLLRNDTTLGSLMQGMRTSMQTQVEYDGKKYSLASFGIMTSTDYTEGGQYHIYGDSEDSVYADKTDKLKAALADDPDAVVNVLSQIFGNLRSTMSDKMAASKVSSALTFYNDIKMKDDISDYEDELDDWEDKLASMEDAYYSKFTAMETALAKLQSQQSSLSSLFGS